MGYFNREECQCKCGCGRADMDPWSMVKFNEARGIAGIPFVVNSAFRCEAHNKNEGGKKSSPHLTGTALDIATPNSRTRFIVLAALIKAGCNRIGVAKTFIHADFDQTKDRLVMWVYK